MTDLIELLDRIAAVLLTLAVAMFVLWVVFSGPGLAGSPWVAVVAVPSLTLATAVVGGLASSSR